MPLNKKEYKGNSHKRALEGKGKRRENNKVVAKQIELNWATSAHDLDTKLRQVEGVLAKGKRVDLAIAQKSAIGAKKMKRKNGLNSVGEGEMEAMVERIRERVRGVGASEWKAASGKVRGMFCIFWQRSGGKGMEEKRVDGEEDGERRTGRGRIKTNRRQVDAERGVAA